MASKKKNPEFTSPKGTLVFPKLTKVDYGTEKYPKKDGEYNVQLRLKIGSPEFDKMVEWLKPLHDTAVKNGKAAFRKLKKALQEKLEKVSINNFYTEERDRETEEKTGFALFKFKMKASGVSKKDNTPWTRKPALFDAKGKPLKSGVQIWGGSVGKIAFAVGLDNETQEPGYFIEGKGEIGISLLLNAVQVIELKQGGRDASGFGFGSEEGYDGADDEDNPGVGGDDTGMPEERGGGNDADDGDF